MDSLWFRQPAEAFSDYTQCRFGFRDTSGKTIIAPRFDRVERIVIVNRHPSTKQLVAEFAFLVTENKQQGILDQDARTLIPIEFTSIELSANAGDEATINLFAVLAKDGQKAIHHFASGATTDYLYDEVRYPILMRSSRIPNHGYYTCLARIGKRWTAIDTTLQQLFPPSKKFVITGWRDAQHFDIAHPRQQQLHGILNKAGTIVVPIAYKGIAHSRIDGPERHFWAYTTKGDNQPMYDIYNTRGEQTNTLNAQYQRNHQATIGDLQPTILNNLHGVATYTGKEVIPCRYKYMSKWHQNSNLGYQWWAPNGYMVTEDGSTWGMLSSAGDTLLPFHYQSIWHSGDRIFVKRLGLHSLLNNHLKTIIPWCDTIFPDYPASAVIRDTLYLAKDSGLVPCDSNNFRFTSAIMDYRGRMLINKHGRVLMRTQRGERLKPMGLHLLYHRPGRTMLISKTTGEVDFETTGISSIESQTYRTSVTAMNGRVGVFDFYEQRYVIPAKYHALQKDGAYYWLKETGTKNNGECCDPTGDWMLTNAEGEQVNDARFELPTPVSRGFVIAETSTGVGLLDADRTWKLEPKYQSIVADGRWPAFKGYRIQQNDQWGYYRNNGKLLEPRYWKLYPAENGFVTFQKRDSAILMGLLDNDYKLLVAPTTPEKLAQNPKLAKVVRLGTYCNT